MTKINSRLRSTIKCFISQYIVFALVLAFIIPVRTAAQDYYPVHATVQVLPPYSLYLSDYSNGFRDRLVVTLYNRDLQQQTLDCRLRLRISNTSGFCIESRDEVPQRSITVEPNVPLRLTSQDIAPYLQPGSVRQTGTLRNGRLPEGMMTFSVQVVEQHTGRILSPWASGRAWLETKKPPMLVMPEKDETIAFTDPQHILFRWYPQHQGLSGVEYELHIRKMLDNCQNPAAQYDSGVEVFTTKTRQTLYNYSNIDPELIPGHTYAWRVRAVAMDGIDEVGVFDNDGYSETGWFRLVRGCDAPVIDRAEAGYRKLDLGWHGSADDMRYTVQYSAEKENGSYNWTDTTTIDNETTLYGLTPGATYSYRVGALCSATGKPVYSQIGTVKIPNRDSISAANCGIAPVYKELSKERKTDLKVGDRVTVGGDYTMLITELNSKGNGVYGGKGRLTFTWVFFVGLEVTFDDLVVNTDGYQIDGTVNTVYDGTNTNIANLDQLSDGGVNNRESRMSADGRSTVMDFSVPPMPRSDLSEDGGSVVVYDLSGAPHTIEIPSNGNGRQSIPFSLTDIDGNTWRFESCDSVVTDSLTGSQKTVHGIKMSKLDAVSGFSKDKLSDKVKARIAFMNGGQYAFDNLSGRYYSRSSKLGKDYLDKSGLGDGTYAPWKLVPMGKSDKIKAGLNPTKIDIDISSVRFVDADGHDLESSYDSDNAVWTVSLTAAATEGNYYNVYAVAKPKDGKGSYQTIGKLFVVSYKTTKADIVLLPVEKHSGDISKLNAEISDIFAPCGVEISITESDALVGNTGWDLNGDGKLSLTNDAETDNVKRSAEMKALEDIIKAMPEYNKDVLYLVYVPNGSKSSGADVEGNWGRGRQIGYVFGNLDARTVAHEVGHAFTLQHTFDRQYGGNETRCKTENLMDYTAGTQLDAFQWEILAHNAPKIVASVADNAEDNWFESKDVWNKLNEKGGHFAIFVNCEEGKKIYIYQVVSDNSLLCVYEKTDPNKKEKKKNNRENGVYTFNNPIPTSLYILCPNLQDVGNRGEVANLDSQKYNQGNKLLASDDFTAKNAAQMLADYHQKCGCNNVNNGNVISNNKSETGNKFQELKKDIQKQLDNEFFGNVKLRVNIEFGDSTATLYSKGCEEGKQDINLDVKIDSLGMPNFKIKASDNYLKEYVSRVDREIVNKGLQNDVSAELLRKQIINDLAELENVVNSQNFIQKVSDGYSVPSVKSLIGGRLEQEKGLISKYSVKGIEAIQATQKICKNVWKDGTIPEGVWYSKNKEHEQWPNYVRQYPIIGGVEDGLVDEVIGIPVAVKGIYTIIIDEKIRSQLYDSFSNILTAEGLKKLYNGAINSATETVSDSEKLFHWGGKTTVSVASMCGLPLGPKLKFAPLGGEGAGGSLAEIGEKIVKSVDNLKLEYLAKIPAGKARAAVESFIKSMSDDVFEALCSDKCKGLQKVLNDMASQGTKFIGGKFQLEYAAKLIKEGFEVELEVVTDAIINGTKKIRRVDIVCKGETFHIKEIELKNWSKMYSSSFVKQFVEFDLVTMTKGKPKIWVFNKTKGIQDVKTLQNMVLKELKKDNVRKKIEKSINDDKIRKQINGIFDTGDKIEDAESLYKVLSDENQFKKIFKLQDVKK